MTYPQPEVEGSGGYVRWRNRMVRQSVFIDVQDVLARTGYTSATPVIALKYPIQVIEFYPEFVAYEQDSVKWNTLAIDVGNPGPLAEWELGGQFAQDYRFLMAFYAETDGLGAALMQDLSDRYLGLTDSPFVSLYDYNAATPRLVNRMEVLQFQFTRAGTDVAPYEYHLFFVELVVRDMVDQNPVRFPS